MKMLPPPRSEQENGFSADHHPSIECKFLGHHHQKLLVGVLISVPPSNNTASASSAPSSTVPTSFSSGLEQPRSNHRDNGIQATQKEIRGNDTMDSDSSCDSTFRRELEQKDAAFVKRIADTDQAFRAKIARSFDAFMDDLMS